MVVDSSALAEQVVFDVLSSAFDSAGQRCSALRVLCIQEDSADHVLTMLRGAMRELSVGNPDRLSVDVGPVIDAEARNGIVRHIDAMRTAGRRVDQLELNGECRHGTFVPPTIIEIGHISELKREIFGPVLHVVRYKREELDALLEAVNGTGYGLTFGVHTRIDETIAHVTGQVHAGNVYVNRNIVGAVVGVPFGGECLSGTGPKAGGPLYMYRLLGTRPAACRRRWIRPRRCRSASRCPVPRARPTPIWSSRAACCVAASEAGARAQWAVARQTGNHAWFADTPAAQALLSGLDAEQQGRRASWPMPTSTTLISRRCCSRGWRRAARAEPAHRPARRSDPGRARTDFGRAGRGRGLCAGAPARRAFRQRQHAAGGNASLMTIG